MNGRRIAKLAHEGICVAGVDVETILVDVETILVDVETILVDVETIFTDGGWSPYLPVEDAYKFDDVRDALRRGAR